MKIRSEYTFSKAEFSTWNKLSDHSAEEAKGKARNVRDLVKQQMYELKAQDNNGKIDLDPRDGFVWAQNKNAGIESVVPDGKFEAWQRNLEFEPKSGELKEYKGYKLEVDDDRKQDTTTITRNQFAFKTDEQGRKHYHENFLQKNVDHKNALIENNNLYMEVVVDDKAGTIALIEDRNAEKKHVD